MARRRRQPRQGDLFGSFDEVFPDEESWRNLHEDIEQERDRVRNEPDVLFVCKPDDRPRCVLCGELARPDSVHSARLDGSVHPKCHEEWLKTLWY